MGGAPLKTRKNGLPIKNKAYKYGMLGESYVHKHIKCPRCDKHLIRNKPNTPATDFTCKNNHWLQLKSLLKNTPPNKLKCGQYHHQYNSLFSPKLTDFMILLHRNNKVKSIYWLPNERIDPGRLKPYKNYSKSFLFYDVVNLIHLEFPLTCLWKPQKSRKKKIYPCHQYQFNLGRHKVNLQNMTCSCRFFSINQKCSHLDSCLKKYLSHQNTRKIVNENSQNYLVDITEGCCSCNNQRIYCDHLRYFVNTGSFPGINEITAE